MKYMYFVAYNYLKSYNNGVGNIQVKYKKPIKDIDDVKKIEEEIETFQKYDKVVVINWKLLDEVSE